MTAWNTMRDSKVLTLLALLLGVGLLLFGVGIFSEPDLRSSVTGPSGAQTGGQYEVTNVSWPAVIAGSILVGGSVHRSLKQTHRLSLMIGPSTAAFIVLVVAVWNTRQGDSSQLINEWSDGRPVRDDKGVAVLASEPNVTAASAAAAVWLEASRHEASSVATFEDLAQHFADVGAPQSLVAGAQRAAAEEARHEMVCRQIARLLCAVVVDEPSVPPTASPSVTPSIVDLAVEAFRHGVVGEGFAVERLGVGAKSCARTIKPLLHGLQHDELGHVELARATIRWAIATAGDEVRHALRVACAELPRTVRIPQHVAAVDPADRAHAGLCTDAQALRAWHRVTTRERTWVRDLCDNAGSAPV